jgi:hypothetical protein
MTTKNQLVNKNNQPATPSRRLPLWVGIVGIALVVGAALLWLVSGRQASSEYMPEVTGGPSGRIDQAYFDYGDVKLGTTIKTVFRVRNVGDAQLAFQGAPRIEVLEGC